MIEKQGNQIEESEELRKQQEVTSMMEGIDAMGCQE